MQKKKKKKKQVNNHDEIKQFLSCRHVSRVESIWQSSKYIMHGQSHAVYHLPVHFPAEQLVFSKDGQENQAVVRAKHREWHLTALFRLSQTDNNAQTLLYCEIPTRYVFNAKNVKWTPRVRSTNIISRVYSASPNQVEMLHLGLLPLHVQGATSF